MDLKDIQEKLKRLRDRIDLQGGLSPRDEQELKSILEDTLITAKNEVSGLQDKLNATLAVRAGNDNSLSDEQISRLRLMEKTGTGSCAVH